MQFEECDAVLRWTLQVASRSTDRLLQRYKTTTASQKEDHSALHGAYSYYSNCLHQASSCLARARAVGLEEMLRADRVFRAEFEDDCKSVFDYVLENRDAAGKAHDELRYRVSALCSDEKVGHYEAPPLEPGLGVLLHQHPLPDSRGAVSVAVYTWKDPRCAKLFHRTMAQCIQLAAELMLPAPFHGAGLPCALVRSGDLNCSVIILPPVLPSSSSSSVQYQTQAAVLPLHSASVYVHASKNSSGTASAEGGGGGGGGGGVDTTSTDANASCGHFAVKTFAAALSPLPLPQYEEATTVVGETGGQDQYGFSLLRQRMEIGAYGCLGNQLLLLPSKVSCVAQMVADPSASSSSSSSTLMLLRRELQGEIELCCNDKQEVALVLKRAVRSAADDLVRYFAAALDSNDRSSSNGRNSSSTSSPPASPTMKELAESSAINKSITRRDVLDLVHRRGVNSRLLYLVSQQIETVVEERPLFGDAVRLARTAVGAEMVVRALASLVNAAQHRRQGGPTPAIFFDLTMLQSIFNKFVDDRVFYREEVQPALRRLFNAPEAFFVQRDLLSGCLGGIAASLARIFAVHLGPDMKSFVRLDSRVHGAGFGAAADTTQQQHHGDGAPAAACFSETEEGVSLLPSLHLYATVQSPAREHFHGVRAAESEIARQQRAAQIAEISSHGTARAGASDSSFVADGGDGGVAHLSFLRTGSVVPTTTLTQLTAAQWPRRGTTLFHEAARTLRFLFSEFIRYGGTRKFQGQNETIITSANHGSANASFQHLSQQQHQQQQDGVASLPRHHHNHHHHQSVSLTSQLESARDVVFKELARRVRRTGVPTHRSSTAEARLKRSLATWAMALACGAVSGRARAENARLLASEFLITMSRPPNSSSDFESTSALLLSVATAKELTSDFGAVASDSNSTNLTTHHLSVSPRDRQMIAAVIPDLLLFASQIGQQQHRNSITFLFSPSSPFVTKRVPYELLLSPVRPRRQQLGLMLTPAAGEEPQQQQQQQQQEQQQFAAGGGQEDHNANSAVPLSHNFFQWLETSARIFDMNCAVDDNESPLSSSSASPAAGSPNDHSAAEMVLPSVGSGGGLGGALARDSVSIEAVANVVSGYCNFLFNILLWNLRAGTELHPRQRPLGSVDTGLAQHQFAAAANSSNVDSSSSPSITMREASATPGNKLLRDEMDKIMSNSLPSVNNSTNTTTRYGISQSINDHSQLHSPAGHGAPLSFDESNFWAVAVDIVLLQPLFRQRLAGLSRRGKNPLHQISAQHNRAAAGGGGASAVVAADVSPIRPSAAAVATGEEYYPSSSLRNSSVITSGSGSSSSGGGRSSSAAWWLDVVLFALTTVYPQLAALPHDDPSRRSCCEELLMRCLLVLVGFYADGSTLHGDVIVLASQLDAQAARVLSAMLGTGPKRGTDAVDAATLRSLGVEPRSSNRSFLGHSSGGKGEEFEDRLIRIAGAGKGASSSSTAFADASQRQQQFQSVLFSATNNGKKEREECSSPQEQAVLTEALRVVLSVATSLPVAGNAAKLSRFVSDESSTTVFGPASAHPSRLRSGSGSPERRRETIDSAARRRLGESGIDSTATSRASQQQKQQHQKKNLVPLLFDHMRALLASLPARLPDAAEVMLALLAFHLFHLKRGTPREHVPPFDLAAWRRGAQATSLSARSQVEDEVSDRMVLLSEEQLMFRSILEEACGESSVLNRCLVEAQDRQEKEYAALHIQSVQRQRVARCRGAARRRERQVVANETDAVIEQEYAALHIQSVQRQRAARCRFSARRQQYERSQQGPWEEEEEEAAVVEQQYAALHVQSLQRQKAAQTRSRSLSASRAERQEREEAQLRDLEQEIAATRIQCQQRKKIARARVSAVRMTQQQQKQQQQVGATTSSASNFGQFLLDDERACTRDRIVVEEAEDFAALRAMWRIVNKDSSGSSRWAVQREEDTYDSDLDNDGEEKLDFDEEEASKAALKIQAVQRGKAARNQYRRTRGAVLSRSIATQLAQVEALVRSDIEVEEAGSRGGLRRIFRMTTASKEEEEKWKEQQQEDTYDSDLEEQFDFDEEEASKAALKIQAVQRGKVARNKYRSLKQKQQHELAHLSLDPSQSSLVLGEEEMGRASVLELEAAERSGVRRVMRMLTSSAAASNWQQQKQEDVYDSDVEQQEKEDQQFDFDEEEASKAALKIQAVQRGKAARNQYRRTRGAVLSSNVATQLAQAEALVRSDIEVEEAGSRGGLRRIFRMTTASKEEEEKWKEQQQEDTYDSDLEEQFDFDEEEASKAALKIQAVQRGKVARNKYRSLKSQQRQPPPEQQQQQQQEFPPPPTSGRRHGDPNAATAAAATTAAAGRVHNSVVIPPLIGAAETAAVQHSAQPPLSSSRSVAVNSSRSLLEMTPSSRRASVYNSHSPRPASAMADHLDLESRRLQELREQATQNSSDPAVAERLAVAAALISSASMLSRNAELFELEEEMRQMIEDCETRMRRMMRF